MDLIDRQAAIYAMCDACSDWCDDGVCKKVSAIQKMPSTQPEHEDGEMFWKNRAKEHEALNAELLAKLYEGTKIESITINENEVVFGGSKPERNKGKWIELTNTNHTYVCSVCGRMLVNITDGKNTVTKNYPFCHCGADMRGENNETD